MGLREILRGKAEKPSLYRRAWRETDNPLVVEARAQTLALQRLQLWLRLAYSVLALAALLAYWGFADDGGALPGAVGVIVCLIAVAVVMVLRTGISHGRANVNAMLEELERANGKISSVRS